MKDPAAPPSPPLPAAPTGNAAAPAVIINGANVTPLGTPAPRRHHGRPSCATIDDDDHHDDHDKHDGTDHHYGTAGRRRRGGELLLTPDSTPTIRFAPAAVRVSRSSPTSWTGTPQLPDFHGDRSAPR